MFRTLLQCIVMWAVLSAQAFASGVVPYFDDKKEAVVKEIFDHIAKDRYAQARMLARSLGNAHMEKLINWYQYQDDVKDNNFAVINRFVEENPHWPQLKRLKNRAEDALEAENIPAATLVKYYQDTEPLTGKAMKLLAEAKINLGHDAKEINALLRKAWLQGDFTLAVEQDFLKRHGKRLRMEDHVRRIDRLLWEDKVSASRRLFEKVDKNHQKLFWARIVLMQNGSGVDKAIDAIPKELASDPGFVYTRIRWHERRKNFQQVYNFMKDVKGAQPYQEKWWKTKNRLIRELLETKQYKEAYDIAEHHGNTPGGADFADAKWLAGWISLRFLNQSRPAYEHFYEMYHNVKFPVSLSRGAYWAARAAEANGNAQIAENWYKVASRHPTTFYGQLAIVKLGKAMPEAILVQPPVPSRQAKDFAKNNEFLVIAHILSDMGKDVAAEKFIEAAINETKSSEQMALIGEFGRNIGRLNLSVIAAKQALQNGVVLTRAGYPVLSDVPQSELPKSLVLGLIRQESRFDPYAQSSANAVGLMQILPSTAKRVARKHRLRYKKSNLKYDPVYNMQLGSYYLESLIKYQEGSYVMAIASYNAGMTNVRRWKEKFGDPAQYKSLEQRIDWIELIPFSETRNYVQRVLENKQVYQFVTQKKPLTLVKDILS